VHNQLDPKQFLRKDPGESHGIKGLHKHFAMSTIIPTSTPFVGLSADVLPRSARKCTPVDELAVDTGGIQLSPSISSTSFNPQVPQKVGTLAAARNALLTGRVMRPMRSHDINNILGQVRARLIREMREQRAGTR